MKNFVILSAVALMFGCCMCVAYSEFETFDSGTTNWNSSGFIGSDIELITAGAGKHIKAHLVRDENSGRFTMPLEQAFTLGSNYDDKVYIEFDVQVVGGYGNYGSMYLGAGNSLDDNFKNILATRIYWHGDQGHDMYRFYGSIYDAGEIEHPYMVSNEGRAGYAYRVKAEYGSEYVDDGKNQGPRLYCDISVYWINSDGSTGKFLTNEKSTQTFTDPSTTGSVTVDSIGIFQSQSISAYERYITCYVDNIYFSTEGFNSNPAAPSWYNIKASDTDIWETFETYPDDWVEEHTSNSLNSFDWIEQSADGYLDVTLVRPELDDEYGIFYKDIGKTFKIDNGTYATEEYDIGWFVQFDVRGVDVGSFSEGFIGTGSSEYGQIYPDQNVTGGYLYGAQDLSVPDGIRAGIGGFGNNYPTDLNSTYLQGGIGPNSDLRFRYAVCQHRKRTRIQADLYQINSDGTLGSLLATDALTFGSSGESVFADAVAIISSIQSTSYNRTQNLLIDNIQFSDVGFIPDSPEPTWLSVPLCEELTTPMAGDVGSAAGAGIYDCVVDFYDLQIMAESWLKIGN
jgi:hypothetical protein